METIQLSKPHPLFKDYVADMYGEIYSLKFGKTKQITKSQHPKGYHQFWASISGYKKMYLWHRFVWECWNGMIPIKLQINHIDTDKKNNNLDNLEVVTGKENMEKGIQAGVQYGAASPNYHRIY